MITHCLEGIESAFSQFENHHAFTSYYIETTDSLHEQNAFYQDMDRVEEVLINTTGKDPARFLPSKFKLTRMTISV